MSLLNTIMSGMTPNTNLYYGTSNSCPDTGEMGFAVAECLQTVYQVENTVNTADIIASTSYAMEGTNPTVVMENVFTNAFEKLKAAFTKLKNKIKQVIDQAIRFFQALFNDGSKFVSKYGSALKNKSTDGFKYKGYVYTPDKGNEKVAKLTAPIDVEIKTITGGELADVSKMTTGKEIIGTRSVDEASDDYKDDFIKGLDGAPSDIGELRDAVHDAYRDGESDPREELELGGKVSAYCTFVSKGADTINKLKSAKQSFETQINSIIKKLDAVKEDSNEAQYKSAQNASKKLTAMLSLKSTILDMQISYNRECAKGMTALLKKFYVWGGKKKGVNESDDLSDDLDDAEAAEAMLPYTECDSTKAFDSISEGKDASCDDVDDDDDGTVECTTESFFGQVEALLGYR